MPYIRDIRKTIPELFKPRHFSSNEQTLELVTGDNDLVLAIVSVFVDIPYVTKFALLVAVVGYIVLVIGCRVKTA
jgi:hypothetical protein